MKSQNKTEEYTNLIRAWNKTHNLISKAQASKFDEHIDDSLSVFEDVGRVLVDIGSGGGLPGIPIAIKGPNKQIVLVESNSKKAAFLLNTKNRLDLKNVTVINARIEDPEANILNIN